jgi:hypothetical protein
VNCIPVKTSRRTALRSEPTSKPAGLHLKTTRLRPSHVPVHLNAKAKTPQRRLNAAEMLDFCPKPFTSKTVHLQNRVNRNRSGAITVIDYSQCETCGT